MTSGNWTVGNSAGLYYATKQWVGANGKTEPWYGGIRSKWNSYDMVRHRMEQRSEPVWDLVVGPMNQYDLASIRSIAGWKSNDELNLLNKLAENVRGHSFDLGINLAEASKSYGTIMKNLSSIGSALRNLKRGDIPSALRDLGRGQSDPSRRRPSRAIAAKDLSGRWLETQYAFLPLIDQSYEASKALESATGPRKFKFTVSSRTFRATADFTSSPSSYSWRGSVTYSRRVSAELYESPSLSRSLGLTNPAAIAWELVPYSFVVDWFVPVGSYLGALGIIPSLQGRFLVIERGGMKTGPVTVGTNPTATLLPYYKARQKKEQRFAYKRTPVPSLSVPRPNFNSLPRALSPKRLLNAVALIHQSLR